jgi:hypothetical protein
MIFIQRRKHVISEDGQHVLQGVPTQCAALVEATMLEVARQ